MKLEDTKKSNKNQKEVLGKIIIIDKDTYYDVTNDIFYKVIKSY